MTLATDPRGCNDPTVRVARPVAVPQLLGQVQQNGRISHLSGLCAGPIVLLQTVVKADLHVWLSTGKEPGNLVRTLTATTGGIAPVTVVRSPNRVLRRVRTDRVVSLGPRTTRSARLAGGGSAKTPHPSPRLRLRISHPGSRAVEFGVRGDCAGPRGDPDRHPHGRGAVIMARDQPSVAGLLGQPRVIRSYSETEQFTVAPCPTLRVQSRHPAGLHPESPGCPPGGNSTPRRTPMYSESSPLSPPVRRTVVTDVTCNERPAGGRR